MIQKLKDIMSSVVSEECQYCEEDVDTDSEGSVKDSVKVPGYTGRHEKWFCCKEHRRKWNEFIEDWENKNHKIPESSKSCPTCMG